MSKWKKKKKEKKEDKFKGRIRTKHFDIVHFSEHSCKPDKAASEIGKQSDKKKKKNRVT